MVNNVDPNSNPFVGGFGDDVSHQQHAPFFAINPQQPLGGPLQSFPVYPANPMSFAPPGPSNGNPYHQSYQHQPYQPQPYQNQQHHQSKVKRSSKRRKLHKSHRSKRRSKSSLHVHTQDDEQEFKFKDVTEIFKNDGTTPISQYIMLS